MGSGRPSDDVYNNANQNSILVTLGILPQK